MSLFLLEPRDPLLVRDGRPNEGRGQSVGLPFPHPGTIAGIFRTRIGSDATGVFDTRQDLDALRKVAIRGPLLVRVDDGRIYVPPPRDAVIINGALRRLAPIPTPQGAILDEPVVGIGLAKPSEDDPPRKPAEALAFWPFELFEQWLEDPASLDGTSVSDIFSDALPSLPFESRTHVKLTEMGTAEESMLFETKGLRFVTKSRERLGLLVDINPASSAERSLPTGIAPVGGKRRLAYITIAPERWSLPTLPKKVLTALAADTPTVRVRVILLTPAIFRGGFRPGAAEGELLGLREGIQPKLVAACVPRPDAISGWDFAKGTPKKTRRLARAGSVYWLDLHGTPDHRVRWAEKMMMTNVSDNVGDIVSDNEQDRHDGYGLAAIGVTP